ncbi:MAG: hypothetical protein MRY83_21570, partial [Flavobacteriales bacterium]|nr:hypothetical protein [Flavobacteriales bacterium]
MSFTTIGAKNSRRVKFWEEALAKKEQKHTFINYDDVLAQKPLELNGSLSVRITSPGEDFELYKKILALGDFPNAENLVLDKGLILPNSNWHVGWKKLLNTIETRCDESVRIMNAPTSIALAFDKLQSQKLLQLRKVKTPKIYLESVQSYDHLMDFLKSEKIHQIFIKPYHGSSASGIMALRISSQKQMLYTTIAKSGK